MEEAPGDNPQEVPEGAASEPAESQDSAPESAEPQDSAPESAEPQDSAPEPAEPQDSAPEPVEPQDSAPEPAEPQDSVPEPAEPQESAPEPAEPQEIEPDAQEDDGQPVSPPLEREGPQTDDEGRIIPEVIETPIDDSEGLQLPEEEAAAGGSDRSRLRSTARTSGDASGRRVSKFRRSTSGVQSLQETLKEKQVCNQTTICNQTNCIPTNIK